MCCIPCLPLPSWWTVGALIGGLFTGILFGLLIGSYAFAPAKAPPIQKPTIFGDVFYPEVQVQKAVQQSNFISRIAGSVISAVMGEVKKEVFNKGKQAVGVDWDAEL